jgi:hypothetical protein
MQAPPHVEDRDKLIDSIKRIVNEKYIRVLVLLALLCAIAFGIFYFVKRCMDVASAYRMRVKLALPPAGSNYTDDDYPKTEPVLTDEEILRQVPDGAVFRHRIAKLNNDPSTKAMAYVDDVDKGINVVFDPTRDDVPKGARPPSDDKTPKTSPPKSQKCKKN